MWTGHYYIVRYHHIKVRVVNANFSHAILSTSAEREKSKAEHKKGDGFFIFHNSFICGSFMCEQFDVVCCFFVAFDGRLKVELSLKLI